ncbi:PREDICTED: NF-kappa-B-repressing factor-like [Dinoponera quadriceps]|uniref:NF-kappa-B-repressing factor-like n=1 Tax=Dinoponera quadriceps TaxID=609295 RepID=A0A6P3WQX1_DINQU|nr:PREDICTED: NF-kappa-B-repressing factor-like [Dinoponera quadriceps]
MTKATKNKRKKEVSQCRGNTSDTESLPEKKLKNTDLPYGDIVLVEKSDDIPQSILSYSVNISGNHLEWKCTQKDQSYDCTVYINSTPVACASGSGRKNAKKKVAVIALDELRKHYYTIKIKENLSAQRNVKNVNVTTIEKTKLQDNIPDDNVGKKLLKLMGWSGGGLGKSQQGITEPVMLKQQLSRKGLGLKSSICTSKPALLRELKAKCKEAFKKLLMGDTENDIIFSTDFTSDERAMIHQVARSMGLKSRSYGPSDQRRLVISCKIDIRSLVEELKGLGEITEKYELIGPTT